MSTRRSRSRVRVLLSPKPGIIQEKIQICKRFHLSTLDLSHLHLTVLPPDLGEVLADMPLCTSLNISFNRIEHLPEGLLSSSHIKYFNCSRNKLKELKCYFPTNLIEIICNKNNLIALPESLPSSLKILDASENQLESLPHHLPRSLQSLNVGKNQLTALPNHPLPEKLLILKCYNNLISELSLLPPNLKFLDFDNNRVPVLSELPPRGLLKVSCSLNPIRMIKLSYRDINLVCNDKDLEILFREQAATIISRFYKKQKIRRKTRTIGFCYNKLRFPYDLANLISTF